MSARQTVAALLAQDGYKVRSAADGQTALTMSREDPPELILLDFRLPDLGGCEVCRLLKESHRTQGIPVIFMISNDEVADSRRGCDAGGADYLTKPFQTGEMLARVKTHSALRLLRRQSDAQNALHGQESQRIKLAEEALAKCRDRHEDRAQSRTGGLRGANGQPAEFKESLQEQQEFEV